MKPITPDTEAAYLPDLQDTPELKTVRDLAEFIIDYEFHSSAARYKNRKELTAYYESLINAYFSSELKAITGIDKYPPENINYQDVEEMANKKLRDEQRNRASKRGWTL